MVDEVLDKLLLGTYAQTGDVDWPAGDASARACRRWVLSEDGDG